MDDSQTPQDPLLNEPQPQSGGGGSDPLEQLKALLKKREVMLPAGLIILLLIGLAAFRGGPQPEQPTLDDPHAAIGDTIAGADSFTIDLTKDYIWISADGTNSSAGVQTTGTVQRRERSFDVTTRATTGVSDLAAISMQTESVTHTWRSGNNAAVQIEQFDRQYATHEVSLADGEEASGVTTNGAAFTGAPDALSEALTPMELHAGAVPLGEHDLFLFEDEVVTLMRDLADASELTSDVTEESGNRVRRYRINESVLNDAALQSRMLTMLGADAPTEEANIFANGQLSMWQDTATGRVHRIGFTTASVAEGLQVSVDYVLTDIGTAPAVMLPESGRSADDLRRVADAVASLGEATVLQQQERALQNLWSALRAYPGVSGSSIPATEDATLNIADIVCGELIDQRLLSTCPADPKTPPGFYGYRSDGVGFVVTALLEESACDAQVTPPLECAPSSEAEANIPEECQALLANSSITRTETGECIYEIRG